jgi:putative Holliday junction resolvase
MGRLVGIDMGELNIGLSISDESKTIAFPLSVLRRENKSYCLKKTKKLLEGTGVEAFVVGLPVRSNGECGAECDEVRAYGESLRDYFNLEVILWDERYTTVLAEKSLLEADVRRENRRRVIDEVAAQILLQSYLDHLHHTTSA